MARTVSVGEQSFKEIRENNYFYVDKTDFIKEWWESGDSVTLITRPRRFGKTLNMSMMQCFFSNEYAGRSDLFEGLTIWQDEKFQKLQGTYPVIFLSFAGIKQDTYEKTRTSINTLIESIYNQYRWILESDKVSEYDLKFWKRIAKDMDDPTAAVSINYLCELLFRYYGKKCIILLDEYDTPLQEAYVNGFWDELVGYTRALFNNTFKTNAYLERGLMTGITRVSKESIFSDLNNLNVISTTSREYQDSFGFTENEVFDAMAEQGIDASMQADVKKWYDGFTFGTRTDIYNPWSITMFLSKKMMDTYWANTSANSLVEKVIREGDRAIKSDFERLLKGDCLETTIDEQIVFDQLDRNMDAVWSLLLASGYLKVEEIKNQMALTGPVYSLRITNYEVRRMFASMVMGWFKKDGYFKDFVSCMLRGDVDAMNDYMNAIAMQTFSYFDTGKAPSDTLEPEKFYHGLVLGLIVDKVEDYLVKSNRESGFGRYDVVMEPKNPTDTAVIMEFKVINRGRGEATLSDTADNALKQIEEKQYAAELLAKGIPAEGILKYGFAFEGKKCLIKKAE